MMTEIMDELKKAIVEGDEDFHTDRSSTLPRYSERNF